jgi:hypothetical protein
MYHVLDNWTNLLVVLSKEALNDGCKVSYAARKGTSSSEGPRQQTSASNILAERILMGSS